MIAGVERVSGGDRSTSWTGCKTAWYFQTLKRSATNTAAMYQRYGIVICAVASSSKTFHGNTNNNKFFREIFQILFRM